jgi:hypothetical protein
MTENVVSDSLAHIAGGGGGGAIGGFLLSRYLSSRNNSTPDLAAKIDRTNELLQQLTVEFAEMKGLLSAVIQRD